MLKNIIKTIKFIFKYHKDLKLLLKEINQVKTSVHNANKDRKIDKAELLDILKEVDDVLEKIIDIVEK